MLHEGRGDLEQEPINDIQHFYLELLSRVRYNSLEGEKVVHDLLEWRSLWYSVIATRLPLLEGWDGARHAELALLRAIRWNILPIDTLYIWTSDKAVTRLQSLIKEHWQPDEVEILAPESTPVSWVHLDDPEHRVLFVWWD